MHHLSLFIMGGFGHIKPAVALSQQFNKHAKIPSTPYDIFGKNGKPNYKAATIYNTISKSPILSPIWNLVSKHDLVPANLFEPIHWLEIATNKKVLLDLKNLRKKYPHLIVTATHWTPALLAAEAYPDLTIFLYVTDIYVHGLWKIAPKNVHYLVPHEQTKIVLTKHGIPPERISLAPFPIHYQILNNHQNRFKKRIGNLRKKNPQTIDTLIMSGGAGTGELQMKTLVDHFSLPAKADQVRVTFLVSTKMLENNLINYCANLNTKKNQILIKRYTPDSLYKALNKAEILITKAGGDITFEALAEGLPIYTLNDVGDHERLNRLYLENLGASKPLWATGHPWDMIQADILTGEIVLMTQAANNAGKFHRTYQTPDIILNQLGQTGQL